MWKIPTYKVGNLYGLYLNKSLCLFAKVSLTAKGMYFMYALVVNKLIVKKVFI